MDEDVTRGRLEGSGTCLLRLAQLAAEVPEIAELDLNPVVVRAEGARAVDVRIRVAPVGPRPDPVSRWLGHVRG